MAIEIYNWEDKELKTTIQFDWNEQIDTIIGDPFVAKRFLALQPIGFMKQRNSDWQSYYRVSENILRRKNVKHGLRYRIKPDKRSDESLNVNVRGEVFANLVTTYYGHHDWSIGSTSADNKYQVDYRFDQEGRIGYMYIKNKVYGGLFSNHVRIYYRPEPTSFPESWHWGILLLDRFQP